MCTNQSLSHVLLHSTALAVRASRMSPVAYASRTLTETEQRYAQIEKGLLAVVFAWFKFYDYIYGKPVFVETDPQPFVSILKKRLHTAPAHLQRMILKLHKFNQTLIYKKGKKLYLADTLSRASRAP